MTARRWLALLAMLLVATAGCGTFTPAPPPPPPPPPATAPESPLPPRPREVRVDGVDPCSLITPALHRQFEINSDFDRRPTTDLLQTSDCQADNDDGGYRPRIDVRLRLIRDLGAEATLRETPVGSRMITIAGFGAVESPPQLGPKTNACTIDVDVADGQMMSVLFDNIDSDLPGLSYELMCQNARTVAEGAMRELLAQVR